MTDCPLQVCLRALPLFLSLFLMAGCCSMPNNDQSAPVASSSTYEGFIDSIGCEGITAWGWDRNRPNDPVRFEIYDGEVVVASVTADKFRQDLLSAGKGNGKHYFTLAIPEKLRDGKNHVITVKFEGTPVEVKSAKAGVTQEITCSKEN